MKSDSQKLKVIAYFRQNRQVNRNWALQNYISRLGAIMCDLKKTGWVFRGGYIEENGGKNYYYFLLTDPDEKPKEPVQSPLPYPSHIGDRTFKINE